MAVDSENLKVVVTLLFSLSLLHLSLFHPIEAAPIATEGNNEGAAGQLVPPSLSPIITKPNNLNPDETSTLPPPPPPLDLGPTQPQQNGVAATVVEESFLTSTSTTESAINEMKLPGSHSDTELDHGLRMSASAGFLLYEIERDILGLSLDDINYILTFGPEVFAYSLADKLGYLQKFNNGDDPHISIIDANKERLMEKLKNRIKQDDMQTITTKEPIFLEPTTTTDPIQATARVPQEISLGLSRDENNLVDPLTITKPDVEPTSQEFEVTPEITTESKTVEYYYEVITTAHDLVISTEDPHSNINGNSTPTNIVPEDNGAQDNSIHDNDMHRVITIEEKLSDDDESASRFFKQMLNDDTFLATLSDKKEELYLKLSQGELDGEAASNLLDRYRVWVNDQMEDSHYGGPGGYYDNSDDDVMANEGNGIGTTEGLEVKPEVEQGEGEGDEISVDNDREPVESESRATSNFGAVHFLVIFIIIGAIMVTGYLCLHNKKKVSAS